MKVRVAKPCIRSLPGTAWTNARGSVLALGLIDATSNTDAAPGEFVCPSRLLQDTNKISAIRFTIASKDSDRHRNMGFVPRVFPFGFASVREVGYRYLNRSLLGNYAWVCW